MFRNLRGGGEPRPSRPGLNQQLKGLEQQAKIALPGFDAQFYNRAGDLCVEADEASRALGYYGRSIDAYLRAGRYNAAGAVCRKLLRLSPGAVRARCTLAWLSIGKGMLGDAQWEVEEYVDAAVRAGQQELAKKQVRMMLEATFDEELRALLGEQLARLGDEEGARAASSPPQALDDEPPEEVWARVLRAALMGPEELRDD